MTSTKVVAVLSVLVEQFVTILVTASGQVNVMPRKFY